MDEFEIEGILGKILKEIHRKLSENLCRISWKNPLRISVLLEPLEVFILGKTFEAIHG